MIKIGEPESDWGKCVGLTQIATDPFETPIKAMSAAISYNEYHIARAKMDTVPVKTDFGHKFVTVIIGDAYERNDVDKKAEDPRNGVSNRRVEESN